MLLVYACQRIKRANGLNYLVALAPFHFPGTGGAVFRPISTIGDGAFGICMPADRESKRGEPFFCASVVRRFRSGGEGGARESVFQWNSTLGDGAFGIYMPACRQGEYAELLFFVLAPLNVSGPGGGVCGESLQSATALLVGICQQDGRGSALHRLFLRFRR